MFLQQQTPETIGTDYLVVGTVDRADWKRGIQDAVTTEDMIERLHDFEEVLHFTFTPTWGPSK